MGRDKRKCRSLACADPGEALRKQIEEILGDRPDISISEFVHVAVEDKLMFLRELDEKIPAERAARTRVAAYMGAA